MPLPLEVHKISAKILSETSEYHVWENMLQRCKNPRTTKYKYYGGRGIKVCERWLKFINFYSDMGKRPEGLTLERINNDKGYSLDNCKWATCSEQARNQKINMRNSLGITGVSWLPKRKRWLSQIFANKQNHFLGHFVDLKEAIIARQEGEKLYW